MILSGRRQGCRRRRSFQRRNALKVSKPKYELMALLIVLAIHAEWETGKLQQYKNHRRHEKNEKAFERRSKWYEKKEKK
jgi:hypothetical protein